MIDQKEVFKQLMLSAICILITCTAVGQDHRSYYKKGRSKIYDITIDTKASLSPYYHCIIKTNQGTKIYAPSQIEEYKPLSEKRYVRHTVDDQVVFIKEILNGRWSLFYMKDSLYQERFFIDVDGAGIREYTKDNLELLKDYWTSSCVGLQSIIDETTLNVESLKRLVHTHNTCQQPFIPRKKYSVGVGIGYAKLVPANSRSAMTGIPIGILNIFDYESNLSFRISAGLEMPIDQSTSFFSFAVKVETASFEDSFVSGTSRFFVSADLLDLSLAAGLKYKFSSQPFRPILFTHLIPTYLVASEAELRSEIDPTVFEGEIRPSNTAFSTIGLGANIGTGFEYDIGDQYSFTIKIGYHHRFGLGSDKVFNISNPFIAIGIIL